jgi:hypothetical protein
MDVSRTALDAFGLFLMTKVRDPAIGHWDKILTGKMSADRAIFEALEDLRPEHRELLMNEVVPGVVDVVLHYLLAGLDEEEVIHVSIQIDSQEVRDLARESDLLVWELYGPDGWIALFSKKRRTTMVLGDEA